MDAPRIAALVVVLFMVPIGEAFAAAPQVRGCLDAGCHRALLDRAGVHRPVVEGACADCHSVDVDGGAAPGYHSGVLEGRLAPPLRGEAVCGACHEEVLLGTRQPPRFGEDGPVLPSGAHRHGPLANGGCGDCHRAHAETPAELVRGELPADAYAPYAADRYSACLGACHSSEIIEATPADNATAFRNGERNLHRVHVVEPRLGRSCRLCHDSHAASNAALVRGAMPFGNESLTLDFESRESGGSCTTSCHMPLAYDRENAVPSRMRTLSPLLSTERR